jgi:hypothetical protein
MFDLPNQRAYVWFVDVPTEHELYKKANQRIRRVDIWVPAKAVNTAQSSVVYWGLFGLVFSFLLYFGYWAQTKQWEAEEVQGVRSAWWGGF